MFDFNDNRYTHMPFAAHCADGQPEGFCCIRNGDGLWKLYHFTGKRWKRVQTGLPEDATECGPTAEYEDVIWRLRDCISALHPSLAVVTFIHDIEWHESDCSKEKFTESNDRFKRNGYTVAKAEYSWYYPRRYIVMNQARLLTS